MSLPENPARKFARLALINNTGVQRAFAESGLDEALPRVFEQAHGTPSGNAAEAPCVYFIAPPALAGIGLFWLQRESEPQTQATVYSFGVGSPSPFVGKSPEEENPFAMPALLAFGLAKDGKVRMGCTDPDHDPNAQVPLGVRLELLAHALDQLPLSQPPVIERPTGVVRLMALIPNTNS